MKTDLAALFETVLQRERGNYRLLPPGPTNATFERFRDAVRRSSASKLYAEIDRAEDLWRLTRLGVIIGDVTLLSGVHGGGSSTMILDTTDDLVSDGEHHGIARALMFYDNDVLQRWAKDAEPFIRDGRVAYTPSRCIARIALGDAIAEAKNAGRPAIEAVDIPEDKDWTLAVAVMESISANSAMLTASSRLDRELFHVATAFEMALPVVSNISLTNLHRFLQNEDDTLASFRAAFTQVVNECRQRTGSGEPQDLERVGLQIRRDIVEPQLESLTRAFKRIMQSRAIRIAGASLGTVAVSLTAAAVQPIAAVIQAALGGGGVGLIAKEYADYRVEMLALKENPWYFAWRLNETNRKSRIRNR